MYFNSLEFIFIFLPITLGIYFFINKLKNYRLMILWLIFASLFFYGWWNIKYLILIISSILINFIFAYILNSKQSKIILSLGILINLVILSYFKYANFFFDNINLLSGTNFKFEKIILPLGISFFTFQQITYLVDTYLKKINNHNIIKYFLFVTFFPQLIAGPIVHHKEMMPQFENGISKNFKLNNFLIGLSTFIIGLFKKVVIADNIALYSDPIFFASANGLILTFFEAWGGATAFMLQLYFDFSGYTDMALGIALLFGITLPINFASPFKSKNISDFWRCWHITLTRLIRNYIYLPISLNLTRFSMNKNLSSPIAFFLSIFFPTMIAFFLVGLWHGSGWNYIFFGLLNGSYIVIFNIWQNLRSKYLKYKIKDNFLLDLIKKLFVFSIVTFSFVLFRASDMSSAVEILKAMLGQNGIEIFDLFRIGKFATNPYEGILYIFILIGVIFYLPNTQDFIFNENKSSFNIENKFFNINKNIFIKWQPNALWGFIFALILIISIMFVSNTNEFLYFEF